MNTSIDSKAFAAAVSAADKAQASAMENCAKAAQIIFSDFNAENDEKLEYARLSELVGATLRQCKVALKHERNILQFIRQELLLLIAPDQLVETETKKGGKILKPARECKTAREKAAAAKTVRESIGLSDGRKNNAKGKRKVAPAVKAAPVTATHILEAIPNMLASARNRGALFKVLKEHGYIATAIPKK
jgi:hypothetical protein